MRIIDADALMEVLNSDDALKHARRLFSLHIKAAPTIDPVKHGRWEKERDNCPCSECGLGGVDYWDSCPSCGAKMDKEEMP